MEPGSGADARTIRLIEGDGRKGKVEIKKIRHRRNRTKGEVEWLPNWEGVEIELVAHP